MSRRTVFAICLAATLALALAQDSGAAVWKVVEEGSATMYIEPREDLPDAENPRGWTAADYDAGSWNLGQHGIGFGDGDDWTLIEDDNDTYSVYTRTEFEVADASDIQSMVLEVLYDDGFVAWINGVPVGRAGMLDYEPVWNSTATITVGDSKYIPLNISAFKGALVDGTNVLAMGNWNRSATSSDLTLIPTLTLYDDTVIPIDLTREPYIQNPTQTSVTIMWKTSGAADSVVEYGLDASLGSSTSDATLTELHEMTLTGLTAGTVYHYRILSNGEYLSPGDTFVTNPPDGTTSFSFIAMGDNRGSNAETASPDAPAVAALMQTLDYAFALDSGDIVYSGGASEYDVHYFGVFEDVLRSTCVWPAIGNHDDVGDDTTNYREAYSLPGGNELYYSFDYANAHFAACDVRGDYSEGSTQYNWLDADLTATTKPWKFVFFHDPAYSATESHGSDLNVRAVLEPLFEKHGVSIVFTGHNHNYQRTTLIKDYYPESWGVIHIVTGGAGAPLYPVTKSEPFLEFVDARNHVVLVEIDGLDLHLEAIDTNDNIFDTLDLSLELGTEGDTVWVDLDHAGVERGSETLPFNTLEEGMTFVNTSGTIRIAAGNESAYTGAITKPMRLEATGPTVRIGQLLGGVGSPAVGMAGADGGKSLLGLIDALRDALSGSVPTTGSVTPEDSSSLTGAMVHEPVLPFTMAGDSTARKALADSVLAVRLRSEEDIDPQSIASTSAHGASVEWVSAIEGDLRDLWVVMRPEDTWLLDDVVSLTAEATTFTGEIVGPVTYDFVVEPGTAMEPIYQPEYSTDFDAAGLDLAAESADTVVVSPGGEGTAPEPLAEAVTTPYILGPERVYEVPQRVWLPVPVGTDPNALQLYYYHPNGDDAGWYPAEKVEGWLVPDSYLNLDVNGTAYLGFLVQHAGVAQLGLPPEMPE